MVIRRVGGLEVFGEESQEDSVVIRRVGGLEDRRGVDVGIGSVIRRVGGLEVGCQRVLHFLDVILSLIHI